MLEGLLGAGKLIIMGSCLAVGFWGAKKLTDKVDVFLATHSKEYRQLVEEMAKEGKVDVPQETSASASSPSQA